MRPTPVDELTATELHLPLPLQRDQLESSQVAMLKSTVTRAKSLSPFYSQHLAGFAPDSLVHRDDLSHLPFVTQDMVSAFGKEMLCVSQTAISRVVTLQTSGSTGPPKRIYYTPRDLDATRAFFLNGMQTFVSSLDRVMVLLPFDTVNSVGDLLINALHDGSIDAMGCWPPLSAPVIADQITANSITSLVGLPQHLLALAHHLQPGKIGTMLLCSDYAPPALRIRIEELTGTTTYLHWGSTETGLGGGVECTMRNGCHLRESQVLVEIIAPDTGRPLPDGEIGEVVITTLARRGMPLIRYRTGDLAALNRGPCLCGGCTARLQFIRGRNRFSALPGGKALHLHYLDNIVFSLEGLLDYRAILEPGSPERLSIEYVGASGYADPGSSILHALVSIPCIKTCIDQGTLELGPAVATHTFSPNHTVKRTIIDTRHKEPVCR